jgi:hypothetical protein
VARVEGLAAIVAKASIKASIIAKLNALRESGACSVSVAPPPSISRRRGEEGEGGAVDVIALLCKRTLRASLGAGRSAQTGRLWPRERGIFAPRSRQK